MITDDMSASVYLYRQHFPWGPTDGYRDSNGRFGFVDQVAGRRRYYTPQRFARRLAATWDNPIDRVITARMDAGRDPHTHWSTTNATIREVANLPSLT